MAKNKKPIAKIKNQWQKNQWQKVKTPMAKN